MILQVLADLPDGDFLMPNTPILKSQPFQMDSQLKNKDAFGLKKIQLEPSTDLKNENLIIKTQYLQKSKIELSYKFEEL